MSEHDNWIRLWAISESRQINRYSYNVHTVLADADRIAAFVFARPSAEVINIVPKGENK